MPVKNSEKSIQGDFETKTIYLQEISDNKDVYAKNAKGEKIKTKNGGGISLPYELTFSTDEKGKEIFKEHTKGTLSPRVWNSNFTINKGGYVTAYGNNALAFIFAILAKQNNVDMSGKFDINTFEGFEFEAVYRTGKDYEFIDWVGTLKVNEIPVPTTEDLGAANIPDSPKKKDKTKEFKDEIVDEKPEAKKMPWQTK